MIVVPESVRAKGSSKSGGLLYIFTCSHLHYPHMFTYSHHLIFTSSHLHIVLPSHTHIFTSSHVLIFTSSHHHICTSSHIFCFSLSLSTFTFTSWHLLTFTYSHLQIFTSSIILYHLLIFTSSHLHIFSLSLLPSVTVSLLLFLFSLKAAGSADEAPRYGNPFAWGSCVKNWECFCEFSTSAATLSHEMRFECQ